MLEMAILILAENEQVINENTKKIINTILENLIYQRLEGSRCVACPHWHHEVLKLTIFGIERCLFNVALPHADLMKAGSQIMSRENTCTTNSIEHLISFRKWSFFLLCNSIKSSQIDNSSKLVRLFHKEQRCTVWILTPSNLSLP